MYMGTPGPFGQSALLIAALVGMAVGVIGARSMKGTGLQPPANVQETPSSSGATKEGVGKGKQQ